MEAAPQLSQCFFQSFLEDKVPNDFKPVLQVLEARPMSVQTQAPQMRARFSDGVFSYSGCTIAPELMKRFQDEGLSTHNGIIRVDLWKRYYMHGKICLQIVGYTLVTLDYPVIGNPQSHSGKTDQYHGLNLKVNLNQVKDEHENSGSVKRPFDPSSTNDERQPLRKRQPDHAGKGGGGGAFHPNETPISVITPYMNRWRICGQVTIKDPQINERSNAKGNFRVFSFTVTDRIGDSIRITAFGDWADKFFPMLQVGQVYYISGGGRPGSVKTANKQFNSTGHDYELVLDRDSEITYCTEDFQKPALKLKYVPLKSIPEREGQCVDVIALVDRINELTHVLTKKDQKQLEKREVFLVDMSNTEVALTLWGEEARNFDQQPGTVIGIRGATVREFMSGHSLSTMRETQIVVNPESEHTKRLYVWYRENKPNVEIKSLSNSANSSASFERDMRLIGSVMRDGVDRTNEKGEYFFVKAMVNAVKTEQAIYQSCPQKNCKKKLIAEENQFRCEKCQMTFDTFSNTIMLQVELADFSGTVWVTMFEEKAELFLGAKADELAHWQKEDKQRYEDVFGKIQFHEFFFRVRAKYETYNDQEQLKWNVFDIKAVPIERAKTFFMKTIQSNI